MLTYLNKPERSEGSLKAREMSTRFQQLQTEFEYLQTKNETQSHAFHQSEKKADVSICFVYRFYENHALMFVYINRR